MEAGDLQKSGRIVVRRAIEEDAESLSQFAAETFRENFGPDNKQSDMDAYLRKSFSPEIQRDEIANSAGTFILALDQESSDDNLIGYAHLIADQSAIELKRIYVATSWKGRGLAQMLFNEALDEGRRRGGSSLWLSVWERNERAIAFYKKMGFRISGSLTFQLGEDTQTDHRMEIAL
jgi:diamine N-acetyltransferase